MIPSRSERFKRVAKATISTLVPYWMIKQYPYRIRQHPKSLWDNEYADGFWDYMKDSNELARYSITAAYCNYFTSGGPILDNGCGDGNLKQHLRAECYTRYVGVDLSEDAIIRANATSKDEKSTFVQANIAEFVPDGMFDVIVFNECLYYTQDPIQVIKRYEDYLNKGGIFIVSMFDMLKSRKIWAMLEDIYQLRESARCINSVGHSSTIRAYSLRGSEKKMQM